jgi:hypothetical protein
MRTHYPLLRLPFSATLILFLRCLISDPFEVVTPINIDHFASRLAGHPNRPFIDSVIRGLREGFWSPAHDHPDLYPPSRKFPQQPLFPASASFCAEEERLGRFSRPFSTGTGGGHLLSGMISVSVPVHTVPKKSGKLQLVVNHSAGEFSPDSHIVSRRTTSGAICFISTPTTVADRGSFLSLTSNRHTGVSPCIPLGRCVKSFLSMASGAWTGATTSVGEHLV